MLKEENIQLKLEEARTPILDEKFLFHDQLQGHLVRRNQYAENSHIPHAAEAILFHQRISQQQCLRKISTD